MRNIESKIGRGIISKVMPNEDLLDAITEKIIKHKIKSGLINIIGALKKLTVRDYDLNEKKYKNKTIKEYLELVSCMGYLSYLNGESIVHLSVSVGRRDYGVIGSHLVQPSNFLVAAEDNNHKIEQKIYRSHEPKYNSNLLDLELNDKNLKI